MTSPTVNSEIFARTLFSPIALNDIFATLKNRDYLEHDLPVSVNGRVIMSFREGLFSRNYEHVKFHENKTLAKISIYSIPILSHHLHVYLMYVSKCRANV